MSKENPRPHKAWKVIHGKRYMLAFGTHDTRAAAERRVETLLANGWLAEVSEGVSPDGRPCFAVYERRADPMDRSITHDRIAGRMTRIVTAEDGSVTFRDVTEESLYTLLREHHEWHLRRKDPDPEYGFIPADEYVESSLGEKTHEALRLYRAPGP